MEKRRVSVPIPGGIDDGQTLRLSLGGNQEIFVTVRVEDSDYFRREGPHVHTEADISLSQAVLGGVIRIEGLYEDLNVRVPHGTSSHSILTLSERGFKRPDSHSLFGDHYVHLKVKIPRRLSVEQRELIEEFAHLESDTPGTINGVDKSAGYKKRSEKSAEKDVEEEEEVKNEGFLSRIKKKIFG